MKAKTFILTFLMMFCSYAFGQATQGLHWTVENPTQYQDPLIVYAGVTLDGTVQTNTNLELGAFCGDEVRGSVKLQLQAGINKVIAYLSVYSNNPNDVITFKLYNHENGKTYNNTLSPIRFGDYYNGTHNTIGSVKDNYVVSFATIAEVNDEIYDALQAAIDACTTGENTVTLLADNISENVTVVQAQNKKVTIEGQGKTYKGTITVDGKSAAYATAALTINNVNFDATNIAKDASINLGGSNATRYTSNVTVESCSFTGTDKTKVGIKNYTGGCKNLVVSECTADGLHSLVQVKGVEGITVAGVIIKNGKNGIAVGSSTNVNIKGSNITATGYGVRADGNGAYSMTLAENTITANLPVVVRKTTGDYKLNAENNEFEALNDNKDVTFTTGDDEAAFEAPKATNATATITGDVTTFGFEARIGNVYYTTFDKAYAVAEEGQTITVLNQVVITEDKTYDKAITVTGATAPNQMFRIQDGANVTVKNANITNNSHYVFVLGAKDKSTAGYLTIENGTYIGETTVAHVVNGLLTINGGEFKISEKETYDYAYLINCDDPYYREDKANVSIKGGKFHNFDPENNAAEGAGTNFCAEGYISEYLGNNIYTVNNGLLGEGTAENPFRIRNLKELTFFRNHVNAGETKYNADGVYVALEADIDMASVDWSVNIGDNCNYTFDGIFDGKNHTIYNLNSKETVKVSDGYICTGLFGAIAGNAVIKNLTIENVDIEAEFAGNNIAAVVGFVWTGTGSIENVTVTGDVNIDAPNAYGVGAIVGYSYSSNNFTVKNCTVNGAKIKAISGAGAIIGYCGNSDIESCKVEEVTIEARGLVGGVAGVALAQTVAKDNTVKNVTLTTTKAEWVNSAAVVVGTMAGNGLTVSNTTIANVNATSIVGSVYAEKPTTVVPAVEARIGDKYYGTFAAAYTAAQAGETITLLQNISSSEIVTLDKAIILDGNGKTLTSTAGRAINVDCVGDVNISNLTITTTNNTERAINVINKAANLTLYKVTAEGFKYTINVASSSVGSTINTIDGKFSGYAAVNITANNTTFNSNDTEFVGINNEASHESNTYAVIAVNAAPTENVKVNINGGKVVAQTAQTNVNKQFIAIVNDAKNANITINAELELADDNVLNATIENGLVVKFNATYANQLKAEDWVVSEPTDNLVTVLGRPVAAIGETKYHTLASAVSAATAGQTIEIIADLNENVTIEKKVTINGNGFNSTGLISTATKNTTYTFKNFNIEGSNNYFVKANGGHGNIVIENCTVKNSQGLLYVNKSTNNVTVKNVNVENCYYGARIITVNNANFENVNISGTKYGIEIQNQANRNVTFKNCNISAETPVYVNPKGTGTITFYFKEINDLGIEELNFGEYAKVVADAMVGTKIYEKFDAALAANGTVKVINPIVITENKEYDFTSETIVGEVYPIIRVQGDATLTIKGTGSITNEKDYVFVLGASDGTSTGNLIIKNGTYKGSTTLASVTKGNLVIEGGEFSINPYEGTNYSYLINCVDANYKNGDATVAISGGRFHNWNPQDNAAEGEHTNFCAQGYAAKEVEENVYEVVEAVAAIGNKSYASIQDAINAAEDGNTIVVLRNINLNETALGLLDNAYSTYFKVEGKTVTIDLNGKTISGEFNSTPMLVGLFSTENNGHLTLVDNSDEGTALVDLKSGNDQVYALIVNYEPGCSITIDGGTYKLDKAKDAIVYTGASLNEGGVTIEDGIFELGNVGTGTNGQPWIFNVKGQNFRGVQVNGGTFNSDINHQFWANEVYVPETLALRNNGNGTWTVDEAEAYVVETASSTGASPRKVGYETLTEALAVADNTTVGLANNITTDASYTINKDKTIVLDLNGKTIAGTDNTSKNFGLFQNNGTLTVNATNGGMMTVVATVNSGWGRYSAVISNNPGATLTVNGGTIEHLGGTDMAYGIDALTNGGIGDVNTTINGGTIKSTYRAVRQFLNSDSKENNLTVNGGTIEGVNKSIFFHDPSTKANNGNITVSADAELYGDVYLYVTAGSTEWPVEVSIANAALSTDSEVLSANVPETYAVENIEEIWTVVRVNTQQLAQNWNWFSSYLNIELNQLQEALGTSGKEIKHLDLTTSYDEEYDLWLSAGNPLTSVESSKMYMIETTEAKELRLTGELVDPSKVDITLSKGWNWIGYPMNKEYSVNEVIANSNLTPIEGDQIKSHLEGFVQYFEYEGQGYWGGTLNTLKPGVGYMYESMDNTVKTFNFAYLENKTRGAVKDNITAENNYWVPASAQFANNMTMVATLDVENANYEVAAFVNGEVRGSARPVYIEALDTYMFFLTIHGDEVEEMTFKCYDINTDTEYTLSNVMNYSNDAVVGSIKNPYLLSRGTLGLEEVSSFYIYPNPTTTDREINLTATCDKVEVFNALGVKVAEYQNVDTLDAFETAGIYVIRVTNNGNVKHCRLVVK